MKASEIEIFPDGIGLSFVLLTFLSKSLSITSLKMQPALRIKTEPKKNNNICFRYKFKMIWRFFNSE